MTDPVVLSTAFLIGIVVEAILLLRAKLSKANYITLALLVAIFGVFIYSNQVSPELYQILIIFLFMAAYLMGIIFAFSHKTFPRITEASALIWNSILLFYYLQMAGDLPLKINIIIFTLSFLTIAINFYPKETPKILKLTVYTWAMVILLFLNIGLIMFSDFFASLALNELSTDQTILDNFVYGMGTMYIGSIIGGAIYLFPRKHETSSSLNKKYSLIKKKFPKLQTPIFAAILILLIVPGLLYLNQLKELIDQKLLIYILILALPLVIHPLSKKPIQEKSLK